jgi:hypothetical protein
MPNTRNPAPSSPATNLRSARTAVRATPPRRETPEQRAARKAAEAQYIERRTARELAAEKQREEAKRAQAKATKEAMSARTAVRETTPRERPSQRTARTAVRETPPRETPSQRIARTAIRETPPRETPSQRTARTASECEARDAERRTARARAADKQRKEAERAVAKFAEEAEKQKKEAERDVAKFTEEAMRKRVVGMNKKRKKKRIDTTASKKRKHSQVLENSSDSGENESDSPFEPTDGADDDDDDDDEGGEISQRDSESDDNSSSSPEDGRRDRARGASSEELRRSAQAGAANPLRTHDNEEQGAPLTPPARTDAAGIFDGSMPLEAPIAQKNVARRIVLFVKNTLFRQIKFVTSTTSFNKAFQKVLAEERPRNPYIFQLTYQSVFKRALNQKRSTCELSGKNIVIRAINNVFKKSGEEFFTFGEFCKLRRATTDREREAFLWFFQTFLECVCGTSAWNSAKTKQLISDARDPSGSKIVSVSDEAFALLLLDNYLEKWKIRADEADAARIEPVGDGAAGMTTAEGENARRKLIKTAGKYTAKAQGQCKWGGWSSEGIQQFNNLRKLVKADREADKNCEEEPRRMEKLLMNYCRTKAGIKEPNNNENLEGARDGDAVARAKATENVEAEWDSDED